MTLATIPPIQKAEPISSDGPRRELVQPARSAPKLGQKLVDAGLLTDEQLDDALQLQSEKGRKLGETLLDLGLLAEEDLLPFIESQIGVPAVRLREGLIDPTAVRLIPVHVAQRLGVLALFKVRRRLVVAMSDPHNLQCIDELERVTGLTIQPVLAFCGNIETLRQRAYEDDFEVDAVTADLSDSDIELQNNVATDLDLLAIESLVEGSPIINLVNYTILQAIRQGASDVHIEPGRKHTSIRFRVDGQLREVLRPRIDVHAAIVSRIKVMSKMDIAEHRLPQDGRCQVWADRKQVDLRISTLPTVLGEKVVMRILDRQNLTFDLHELGIPSDQLRIVKSLLARPNGLFLVTGPTGSGKTTTLYSALELIKSEARNIVTVEDPVEYQIELVNQVLVDEGRSLGFATALRSILRQDPDIIMVGEIRDAETAMVAVQAALTGHLVLSTLHTNDSAGAIVRLMDMGLESYKVSAALAGVIAQRLVRTICPKCRSTHYPRAELLQTLHYEGDFRRSFSRGEGCRDCHDTGFAGRKGIYEVFAVDSEIRALIASGAPVDTVREKHRAKGGSTLLQQGLRLAEQEVTSLDEVTRVAYFE